MTDDTSDKEDGGASADFHQTVLRGATKLVAPMVDASELAWRMLARNHGAELCFTYDFFHLRHELVFILSWFSHILGQCSTPAYSSETKR